MKLLLGALALAVLLALILRDRVDTPIPAAESRDNATVVAPRESNSPPIERRIAVDELERRNVLEVPPAEMASVIRETRRVRPDRRVLLAVGDLHRLFAGGPVSRIYTMWRDSSWSIEYGDPRVAVGTLPELASVSDARALLQTWVGSIKRAGSAPLGKSEFDDLERGVRIAIDSVSAPAAFNALARLDAAWAKSRDVRLLPLAADAFATLATMSDDQVDMSDAMLGRALAVTVAARSVDSQAARRADVLIASALGYGAEAMDSARALDATDPARMFLLGQGTALASAAERDDAEPLARYLAVIRAGDRGEEAWYTAIRRYGLSRRSSSATLKTAFVSGDFGLERSMPYNAPAAVTAELREIAATKDFGARMSHRVRTFFGNMAAVGFSGARGNLATASGITSVEKQLTQTAARFSGTMIDSSVVDSYFRSFYYSALVRAAEFNLETLSSVSGSLRLADDMNGDLPSGPAPEYAAWLRHLADLKAGRGSRANLVRDVQTARWLGHKQARLTFDEIERDAQYNQYRAQLGVARIYAARLDARPAHVRARGDLTGGPMWDIGGAERFHRRAAALIGDPWLVAWVARLVRDTTTLARLASDTTSSIATRLDAMRQLARDSLGSPALVRRQFEALIAKKPEDWDIRSAYFTYLRSIKDFTAAEQVAKEWLENWQGRSTDAFSAMNAREALAHALQDQKRYQEAWDVIEPVIGSYKGNVMNRGAHVLAYLGRVDDAAKLSAEIVDRYPDAASSHVTHARVLWQQKKYAEAAKHLSDSRKWIAGYMWKNDLARELVQALGDQPETEALAAFQALQAANISPWNLSGLANGLAIEKRPDLAFALYSRLESTGGAPVPLEAASALRQWRGEDAAVEFLRRQMPGGVEGRPAMTLYQYRGYEELWTLRSPTQPESPFTWLMRAAAAASDPAIMRKHRGELLTYYQRSVPDPYFMMGRHLMGLTSANELLALADSPKRRCEIAYYVGLRAMAEGRPYDATDWYLASVATGQERDGELIWSVMELGRLSRLGHSLAVAR